MRILALLAVLACPVQAAWTWGEPLTVNSAQRAAVFPHLESSNRQGVAVSGGTVGVVWEDNRDGLPKCYLATKSANDDQFQPEIRLGQGECYEPVVLAWGAGRFVTAWEEAGRVHAQVLPDGVAIRLTDAESAQVTLAAGKDALYAAWAEQTVNFRRIVVARLSVLSTQLAIQHAQPIEAAMPVAEQSWPAMAVAGDGSVTVAWEDRRDRHTVPMVSHAPDGSGFSSPVRLTDLKSGGSPGLGAGTGAMRPTLTVWGEQGLAAAWLDKRDFLSGYDVYAALDGGTRHFGRNLKAQDSFGDNMAQWHAQIAGDASGRLLALWDDARDGTQDVWLADWNGESFGDNVAIPAASGPGTQSDPVATWDDAGRLHLIWLDRDEQAGTRIRYVQGERR